MALASGIAWEVRTTSTATVGNMSGGGFKAGASGSDFSQQDSPQYALTGGTSAGAGAVILHASAASDMVGNVLYLVSGTNATAGWYEITAVSAGVSITVDRNCTTGVGASIVFNVGGAIALGTTLDSDFFGAVVAGNTVHVKSGTYTLGEAVAAGNAGTLTSVIKLVGYNSSRGDNPTAAANKPTFNNGSFTGFTTGAFWELYNLNVTGTAASTFTLAADCKAINCKFINTSTTTSRNALSYSTNSFMENCEMISYRGMGINGSSSHVMITGCYVHDCAQGINHTGTANPIHIIGTIVESCSTGAVKLTASMTSNSQIRNCTFYGGENKTGVGLDFAAGVASVKMANCIVYGFTTGVKHGAANTSNYDNYNAFNNNTTNATNWTLGPSSVTTAPGFTSVSQVVVTTATTANAPNTLTKAGATFITSGVVAGRDYVNITSTGGTAGIYGIVSVDSETQLTLDLAPGASSGNVSAQITVGRNFGIGTNLQGLGTPGAFQGGYTTGYNDIGAADRRIDVPAVGNVRSGTSYDNSLKTGTLAVPSVANVLLGVAVDATTGTYTGPATTDVKVGVTYGASLGSTGTYNGSDRWTDPGESNVRSGTAYKANSTTNNKTGTLSVTGGGGSGKSAGLGPSKLG